MTPKQLFDYADRFARRHEDAGKGTVCPTLRQVSKRFRCTYDEIEDACEEGVEDCYLGIATAFGIAGYGHADITPRGAQLVEAYK